MDRFRAFVWILAAAASLAAACSVTRGRALSPATPKANADPVVVHGFAAGSAAHGPHCRPPFEDRTYDAECGLVYAIDPTGHFRQIREYRDPRSPFVATQLALGADGRIYGMTSVAGLTNGTARPVIFRYSSQNARFEIVHRFAPGERILGLRSFAVDRGGVAYVFATVNALRDRADTELLRVTDRGVVALARLGNVEPAGPPKVANDGTIRAVLAGRSNCWGTLVTFVPGRNGAGYRSGERPLPIGCRPRVNGRDTRAADGSRLVMYADRVSEIGASRVETTGLPASFGHFAAALVPAPHGVTYALAAGSNGDVCMRLVRVARGGVDVLHTFRHEDGWCLPPSICIFPRVVVSGGRTDVTTARGAPCATGVTLEPASSFDGFFGSVAHVAPDGALRFAFADPRQ